MPACPPPGRCLGRYLERKAAGEAVHVRQGLTLEVRLDPPGHHRGEADIEILNCAADLDRLNPTAGTRILTDDCGMRLRGQSRGLAPLRLPARYRKTGTGMDVVDVPAPSSAP